MNTKKLIMILSALVVISLFILFLRVINNNQVDDIKFENDEGENMTEEVNENTTEELENTTEVNESNIVILETNKGNIEIELYEENAPITVANFKSYVKDGYFDGLVFHRVIKGFMIQGGGFEPNGSPRETNDPIVLESDNGLSNDTGTIAMARTNDPDSATSQFFINTVDNDFLNYSSGNPGYAVFGKVVDGMDVVYEIESLKTTSKGGHQDWPEEDVIIIKAFFKE